MEELRSGAAQLKVLKLNGNEFDDIDGDDNGNDNDALGDSGDDGCIDYFKT